jgi:hypothetical protein
MAFGRFSNFGTSSFFFPASFLWQSSRTAQGLSRTANKESQVLSMIPGEIPQNRPKSVKNRSLTARWADQQMPVVKSGLPVCCPSPIGITSDSLDPNGFETARKFRITINCDKRHFSAGRSCRWVDGRQIPCHRLVGPTWSYLGPQYEGGCLLEKKGFSIAICLTELFCWFTL